MSGVLPMVWTDRHESHDTDRLPIDGYPFRLNELPERVTRILEAVWGSLHTEVHEPRDSGLEPLLAVHDAGYLEFLRDHRSRAGDPATGDATFFPHTFPTRPTGRKPTHPVARFGWYSFDVWAPVLEGTWEAVYWSAQCAVTSADLLCDGAPIVYSLCRPPGHHAGADYCGGLCYVNNTAVAARRLAARGYRVAILDIDYHHGNGTQHIFYSDPSVLFCSLHIDPAEDYPYFWGCADETGEGEAIGSNRNFPLPRGTTFEIYRPALEEALAAIGAWGATALVVAAGFDTAEGDPLGLFRLARPDFAEIGSMVRTAALPTLVVQEGGYNVDRVGGDVVAFHRSLLHGA